MKTQTNTGTKQSGQKQQGSSRSNKSQNPNPGKPGNSPDVTPTREVKQTPVAKPKQ